MRRLFVPSRRARGARNTQLREDALSRFTTFEHRGHDEVAAPHHITAGKYFRMGRLKGSARVLGNTDATIGMTRDTGGFKPIRRTCPKAERNDDRIGRNDGEPHFGALGPAAPLPPIDDREDRAGRGGFPPP